MCSYCYCHYYHHHHHHQFHILISYAELTFSHWCWIAFVSVCPFHRLSVLSFHLWPEPKSFKKKNWPEHYVWRWMSFIGLDRDKKFQSFLPSFPFFLTSFLPFSFLPSWKILSHLTSRTILYSAIYVLPYPAVLTLPCLALPCGLMSKDPFLSHFLAFLAVACFGLS